MDKNLYDLPPAELAEVPTVCASLREELESLAASKEVFTKGAVFSSDQIDSYIELKMEEVARWEMNPAPVEFDMYYSRPEDCRVGKECVSQCHYGWSQ